MTKFTSEDFTREYAKLVTEYVKADGLFDTIIKKFEQQFKTGGFSNEQIASAKVQFFSTAYQTLEAQASANTLEILKSGINEALQAEDIKLARARVKLVDRERFGFDDNLRVKLAEFRGNLASFAVNVDSTSKQDALDKFDASVVSLIADINKGSFIDTFVVDEVKAGDTEVIASIITDLNSAGAQATLTIGGVIYYDSADEVGHLTFAIPAAVAGTSLDLSVSITDNDASTVTINKTVTVI